MMKTAAVKGAAGLRSLLSVHLSQESFSKQRVLASVWHPTAPYKRNLDVATQARRPRSGASSTSSPVPEEPAASKKPAASKRKSSSTPRPPAKAAAPKMQRKFVEAAASVIVHQNRAEGVFTAAKLAQLEKTLRYTFKDPGLLRLALTHRSAAAPHNATMAWVGDAALYLILTEELVTAEGYAELLGGLSIKRTLLVSREHCCECALDWGLDQLMLMGRSMMAQQVGVLPRHVLAEAFEAVMGAVFVDGGLEAARHVYRSNFELETELRRMQPGLVIKDMEAAAAAASEEEG